MKRTITTSGRGSVGAAPDSLRLNVTVASTAPSVSDALDTVASGVTALGEVAREYVGADDIASHGLNVYPSYDREGSQNGYRASHSLILACDDLAKAGQLIPAVGALMDLVTIDGMDLAVSEPEPLQAQARARAFADARAKADELAALAGVTVRGVRHIVEGGAIAPSPVRQAFKAMDSMPIEAGTQDITAALTVTWQIEN
ncbi:MAG: SIMPL domain-containing protein [Nocardioidaceae bacterium]|nr:MAG: SIMPL domain-containing protein [Nocardioidaceae bacterium]